MEILGHNLRNLDWTKVSRTYYDERVLLLYSLTHADQNVEEKPQRVG